MPPPAAATRLRIAPDLLGLPRFKARALLAQAEIEFEATAPNVVDESIVTAQRPLGGSVLPAEAVLLITDVRPPAS